MGFKFKEEEEEELGSKSLRGWEGGGGGNGVRQSEAIAMTSGHLSPTPMFFYFKTSRNTKVKRSLLSRNQDFPQPVICWYHLLFFFIFFILSTWTSIYSCVFFEGIVIFIKTHTKKSKVNVFPIFFCLILVPKKQLSHIKLSNNYLLLYTLGVMVTS